MRAYLQFQIAKRRATKSVKSSATAKELLYMHDILTRPLLPMHEYAKSMGVTLGTYTTVCQLMIKKGLAEMRHSPKDKRIKLLTLTQAGEAVVAANLRFLQALIDRIIAKHGASAIDSFALLLDSAVTIMGEQHEN